MPSSATAVSPPLIKPLTPVVDDVDEEDVEYEYEYEYEEIEVEEEVEVEEGMDEEVEEEKQEDINSDESEIGEDLTPVREENRQSELLLKQINPDLELVLLEEDTNKVMESEEHEEHLNSGSLTLRISVANSLHDIATKQDSAGDLLTSESTETGQKKELCADGERTSRDSDPKAPFDHSWESNGMTNKHSVEKVRATLTMTGVSSQKDNPVEPVVAETIHTDVEAVDGINQMPLRVNVPPIRPRDSSSSAEFDGENKRPRIVCEFHAKGWCIRGKSCRFLHIKEGLDAAVQKIEFLDAEASSGAHIPPLESRDNSLIGQSEKLTSHKDDQLGGTLEQAGRKSLGQYSYSDDFSPYVSHLVKNSSINRNRTHHGNFPGCSLISCDNRHKTRISSFGTMEETVNQKSELMHNDHRLDLSYSCYRPPLSFGPSSWTTDAVGSRNVLESSREYRASVSSSLRRSISPVSASNSGSLSGNNIIKNTHPAKCKTKRSYNNWEPSLPFRPSHAITQNLLLKESLYDPIRDSIEQTDAKDGVIEYSCSDQGITNAHLQSNDLQEAEKDLNSGHVEDTRNSNLLSSSCDNRLKFDMPRHKMELKIDGSDQNNDIEVEIKRDGCVQYESKALKYFHGALVEFVKELVKPTWRQGLMSKDAHKKIVKKAVDKVLSTLQPHQIPDTAESIKSYLSLSQPKLARLVEGYIEKYGKS